MKELVRTLIVGSVLSVLAGTALAAQLHCSQTKCHYTETLKGSHSQTFTGYCDGTGNTKVTDDNSSMTCHKAKGLTCTGANWTDFVWGKVPYWSCTCTNWNTKQQTTTIDVGCPAPS